jgi:hypothetical protein
MKKDIPFVRMNVVHPSQPISDFLYKDEMQKILVRLCIFIFICSICIAGQSYVTSAENIPTGRIQKNLQTYEIKGSVDSVVLEDLVYEIRPKIKIIAENGDKYVFIIRSTTTIYDTGWKPTTLDKIMKGQYVRVKYKINKDGFKVALSIKPSHKGSVQDHNSQKPK